MDVVLHNSVPCESYRPLIACPPATPGFDMGRSSHTLVSFLSRQACPTASAESCADVRARLAAQRARSYGRRVWRDWQAARLRRNTTAALSSWTRSSLRHAMQTDSEETTLLSWLQLRPWLMLSSTLYRACGFYDRLFCGVTPRRCIPVIE